jgi:hypothetical protein
LFLFVAEPLPGRQIRSLADGGDAPKDYIRQLPNATHAVGRVPISATLSAVPPPSSPKRRGAPRKKGALLGWKPGFCSGNCNGVI